MVTFANTNLPNDFVEQVERHLQNQQNGRSRDVQAAILAILNRPLTHGEKWAIIDQAAANSPGATLDRNMVDRIARGGRD